MNINEKNNVLSTAAIMFEEEVEGREHRWWDAENVLEDALDEEQVAISAEEANELLAELKERVGFVAPSAKDGEYELLTHRALDLRAKRFDLCEELWEPVTEKEAAEFVNKNKEFLESVGENSCFSLWEKNAASSGVKKFLDDGNSVSLFVGILRKRIPNKTGTCAMCGANIQQEADVAHRYGNQPICYQCQMLEGFQRSSGVIGE